MAHDTDNPSQASSSARGGELKLTIGGLVHAYQGYDPQRFPSPTSPPQPDAASAAMQHMMMFGDRMAFTEEQLRNAIRIDPSRIAGLGPSLEALIRMLEERKRKILETYEIKTVRYKAMLEYQHEALSVHPPQPWREQVEHALRRGHIPDLEKAWYAAEKCDSRLAGVLLKAIERLGAWYEVEGMEAKWTFTGREAMRTVEQAQSIREQLETIDRLIEQLKEAMKNAQIGIIDLDELREFVDDADVDQLRELGQRIEQYVRELAAEQGLHRDQQGRYTLTPKALRIFQAKLLDEIFADLEAGRRGRHSGPIEGEGVVEMSRTRPYEFGDAMTGLDLTQTILNAAARQAAAGGPALGRVRVSSEDLEIHQTRHSPRCATCLLVDMSGSMAHGMQYVQCKRMALAMDGLIRSEYPGDFLRIIEVATFARTVPPAEIISLLPRPVTTHRPFIRLRVDMSDPEVTESMIHPHFTNIQHGLRLARQHLANVDTPNKQIILFTDGLPTAHFENGPDTGVGHGGGGDGFLYLLYPPDPLTERATLREAMGCQRDGITINIFLLPGWSQTEDDIAFAQRMAQETGGRVLFVAGEELDRFVLWDYVAQRRKIIG